MRNICEGRELYGKVLLGCIGKREGNPCEQYGKNNCNSYSPPSKQNYISCSRNPYPTVKSEKQQGGRLRGIYLLLIGSGKSQTER